MFVTKLALALLLIPSLAWAQLSKPDGTQASPWTDFIPSTSSGTPAVSNCGSTPNGSVSGNDTRGTITVGGGAVTTCTLTLTTSPNSCILSGSGVTAILGHTLSGAVLTISASLTVGGGKIYYHCFP